MNFMISFGANIYPGRKENFITTKDGSVYRKPDVSESICAGAVSAVVASPLKTLPRHFLKGFMIIDNLKVQNVPYKTAVEEAFKNSGLAKKGVKLLDAATLDDDVLKILNSGCIPAWYRKIYPEPIINGVESLIKRQMMSYVHGNNAGYLPKMQSIIVNMEKMAFASFHEMGHALNHTTAGAGKVLQKMRLPMKGLASLIFLVAAFKPKKAQGEDAHGAVDKTTTFIKNNAGKLAFLTSIPLLAEEGLASIKGLKLAKPLLSAESYKHLKTINLKAWLTYLAGALCFTLAVKTASWIHDIISSPKKVSEPQ